MSRSIDERVVQMTFDNAKFEKNAEQSMSTIEKLKQSLDFSGAAKSAGEFGESIKRFNLNPLGNAAEAVSVKFSAMEVAFIEGIRRMVNTAMDAGEKLVKSLSTDNIAAGWEKYGKETTAVSTLKAQGYELERIESVLEQLSFFTDETSYEYNEMVDSIGKFTAAGQGLEDSLIAMQGIASWAALSGQNATTASRAMYQLSQAMGSGIMRKEDYKSIQTANMDTIQFRQRAIDAALALGTLKEVSSGVYKSLVKDVKDGEFTITQFADHLTKDMWFTSDVMMMVYRDYGKAANGLKQFMEVRDIDTASSAIKEIRKEAQELADEMIELGEETDMDAALNNAIKVVSLKTFENDVETLQKVNEFMAEYNANLEDGQAALENQYDAMVEMGLIMDQFSLDAFEAGQQARTWEDAVNSVKDAVSSGWSKTFKFIFGNQEEAIDLWTQLANDFWDIFASSGENRNGSFGIWRNYLDPEIEKKIIKNAEHIADEAAKAAYISSERSKYRVNGRDLLFSTDEENLGAVIQLLQTLKDVLSIVTETWNEMVYGTSDADEVAQKKADTLMKVTKAIKSFADSLAINEERAEKLRRTFKGLFAIVDIIKEIFSEAFLMVLDVINELFGETTVSVLDTTAAIGDNISAFRDWIKQSGVLKTVFGTIGKVIVTIIKSIKTVVEYIKDLPFIQKVVEIIRDSFDKVIKFFGDFREKLSTGGKSVGEIFNDMFSGNDIIQNVKTVFTNVINTIKTFFTNVAKIVPKTSKVNDTIGKIFTVIKNVIDTIIDYLHNSSGTLTKLVERIKEAFSLLTPGDLAMIGAGAVIIILLTRLSKIAKTAGGVAESFNNMAKSITGFFNGLKSAIKANTVMFIAGAILMIVGALAAIAVMDPDRLWGAVAVLGVIVAMFTALLVVVNQLKNLSGAALAIGGLAAALALLGLAVGSIAKTGTGNLGEAAGVLALFGTWLFVLGGILSRIVAVKDGILSSMIGVAIMFVGMGAALYIMSGAIAKLAEIDFGDNFDRVISLLWTVFSGMSMVSAISGLFGKGSAGAILGAAASLWIILLFIKKVATEDYGDIFNGLVVVRKIFETFRDTIGVIAMVSAFGKQKVSGIASSILAASISLFIILEAMKKVSEFPAGSIDGGLKVVASVMGMMAILLLAAKAVNSNAKFIGSMLLQMSLAVVLLSGVIWALGTVAAEGNRAEGMKAATLLLDSILVAFALVVKVARNMGEGKKSLQTIISAIETLVLMLALMTFLTQENPDAYVTAATGMMMILGAIAAVFYSVGQITGKEITKSMKSFIGIFTLLTVVLGLFMIIPTDNVLEKAAGLSVCMLALIGTMILFSKLDEEFIKKIDFKQTMASFLPFLAFMVLIGAALAIMSALPQASNILQNAISISLVMIALTGCMFIISKMQDIGGNQLANVIAILIALGFATVVLGVILAAVAQINKDTPNILEQAIALSIALVALSAVVAILSSIGALAKFAYPGMLALAVLIIGVAGIAAILSSMKDMAGNMEYGLELMSKVGLAIGEFVGNIIGGLLGGIFNGLVIMGQAIAGFFNALGDIDPAAAEGAGIMAGVIATLAGASFLDAITSLISGPFAGKTSSMQDFGSQLSSFGTAMGDFYESTKGIKNANRFKLIAEATSYMVELSNGLTKHGGVIQGFLGDNTLTDFAMDLIGFIPKLMRVFETINANSVDAEGNKIDIIPEQIDSIILVATKFNDLSNQLTKHGGVWQALTGDNTLSQFADDLSAFIPKLMTVFKTINANSVDAEGNKIDIIPEQIDGIISVVGKFNDLSSSLTKHGGVAQFFTGDYTLTQFGTDMYNLTCDLVKVSNYLKQNKVSKDAIENATNAAELMVGLQNGLPTKPSVFQDIFGGGQMSLEDFSKGMEPLAVGLKTFSDKITEGSGINTAAVTAATDALSVMSSIQNGLKSTDNFDFLKIFTGVDTDIKAFADNMPIFGTGIKAFSDAICADGGIDSSAVTAAARTLQGMAELAKVGSLANVVTITGDLKPIADNLKLYADTIAGTEGFSKGAMTDITNSVNQLAGIEGSLQYDDYKKTELAFTRLETIVDFLARVSTLDSKKIEAFGTTMAEFSTNGFTEFLNAFNGNGGALEDGAMAMMNSFVRGVKNNENLFTDAFKSVATAGATTIKSHYSEFVDAGSELSNGVIDGMKTTLTDQTNGLEAQLNGVLYGNQTQIPDVNDVYGGGEWDYESSSWNVAGVDIENGFGDVANTVDMLTGDVAENTSKIKTNIDGVKSSIKSIPTEVTDAISGGALGGITDKLTSAVTGGFNLDGIMDTFQLQIPDIATDMSNFIQLPDTSAMFSQVGGDMMSFVNGGMTDYASGTEFTGNINNIADTFVSTMNTEENKEKYRSTGRFAVDGFVDGMKQKTWYVKDQADEIGKALIEGLETKLKIQSPSKVMYGIGDYAGQGFVNALRDYAGIVYNEGGEVGTSATDGIRAALEQSSYMFDTSVDVEPTIRPVLDLSNIDEGIGQMNGMFDTTRSVQLAGSANVQMSARDTNIQNEIKVDNSDVVTAIGTLKNDIADMAERLSNLQVRLDSNVLVGEMVAPMNKALGTSYRHSRREK